MNPKNKLAEMPVRPLLYTMAVPLMLSLLLQSLYNIVDSIFVARLSETALTAASLVYAIQFLMIAIGVGTTVGLNALLSRKLGHLFADLRAAAFAGRGGHGAVYGLPHHRRSGGAVVQSGQKPGHPRPAEGLSLFVAGCDRHLPGGAAYNDPLGYADLILNGDPKEYLRNVAFY